MDLRQGIEGLRSLPDGAVVSIGNYDGVHVGHRAIVEHMRSLATPTNAPIAIVTFEPHPLTVLRPQLVPPRLSSPQRKKQLLAQAGVTHAVVLPPSPDVLGLTAEQFWHLLRDEVRPSHVVEGTTFNFGKDRGGTIDRLREWATSTSIGVHVVPSAEVMLGDRSIIAVSSSTIRWLLGYGRVRDAAACLGRSFELSGVVKAGFQRGRTIGVPTANLDCGDQLVPADGVYAGECDVDGHPYRAAVSIGTTPTFNQQQYQVEAHLIDFSGDLYGRTLDLRLVDWVRDQMKFPSVDALKEQLARDIAKIAG
jgi:riboflavin kinase / FMN adenylyltransferase